MSGYLEEILDAYCIWRSLRCYLVLKSQWMHASSRFNMSWFILDRTSHCQSKQKITPSKKKSPLSFLQSVESFNWSNKYSLDLSLSSSSSPKDSETYIDIRYTLISDIDLPLKMQISKHKNDNYLTYKIHSNYKKVQIFSINYEMKTPT